MALLPEKAYRDVKLNAEDYYNNHLWAKAFLYNAVKLGEPVHPERLTQDDQSMMFLVATRFDSFKKKFAAHNFNDKEVLYGVSMIISFNKEERLNAIQNAQQFIGTLQTNTG